MDASDAVGLARVATCSRALQNLFSDGAVKASMTHCREASERGNLLEAQLNRVVQERDAAREQRLEVSMGLRATVREQAVEGVRMRRRVRQLEQALADSQRELAEAKRARTS